MVQYNKKKKEKGNFGLKDWRERSICWEYTYTHMEELSS